MSAFEQSFYQALILGAFIVAPMTFAILFKVSAPYGRHTRAGWGPHISRRLGWILMELPSALAFGFFFLIARPVFPTTVWLFFGLWQMHYLYRSLVYPFRIREAGKTNPVLIVFFAILFNVCNGYLNGRYLGLQADSYTAAWLTDPRFLIGAALFVAGFGINLHSDEILLKLRRPGESEYKIPQGGLYRFVSCPNYFGELMEWTGWAVMTWSLPGLAFAVWTAANLIPRALTHHRWYQEKFSDYPRDRKALVPFIF